MAKISDEPTSGQSGQRSRRRSAGSKCGTIALLLACLLGQAAHGEEPAYPQAGGCAPVGTWLEPASGREVAIDRLLTSMAQRPVVLLGESHEDAEHHRWQLQVLAALHGRHPNMVLGFESFPRRVQPVLDRWVNGELGAQAFLDAVDWRSVWGYDPAFYLPLFHFARQNRIPMVALNVDRSLVAAVARRGWAAMSVEERAGLSDPAPPSDDYRDFLAQIFLLKRTHGAHGAPGAPGKAAAELASVVETEDFARFVQAQLTWDRAMAEALEAARRRQPGALAVGIMGRGHVQFGYGVPSQLAALGIGDAAVLLPVDRSAACKGLPADLADAVFLVEPAERVAARPRPRLGIHIEAAEGGVRITRVVNGSVAAASGLAVDDVVVAAAGFPVAKVGELIQIVQRQAPGTWLPLVVRRGDQEREVLAKFPTVFQAPE